MNEDDQRMEGEDEDRIEEQDLKEIEERGLDHLEDLEGVLRFASLDDGGRVLAYAHATAEGQVTLALSHELDGDLEVFMTPKTAEELALVLARASDEAREAEDGADG
jgi:hypothetical protein